VNTATQSEIFAIAEYARKVLPLSSAKLSEEYFYQSLPLCIIDTVFSIGVKYDSTREVVIRYCKHTSQSRIHAGIDFPPQNEQESISSFCARPEQSDLNSMARCVYQNRQRTSTRNGILKAEAVLKFARVLQTFGVEYFQDLSKVINDRAFDSTLRTIPGQRSGISIQYFWMLAGSENFVKPDRMVVRFLEDVLSRKINSVEEAAELLQVASNHLLKDFRNMNPRLLDHEVWKYQRSKKQPT
jgi:hypothetical protein